MTETEKLEKAITRELGDPQSWGLPVEFPDSLALCVLNSVYSLRATSTSGQGVLSRYRAVSSSADSDSGPDLVARMDAAGGPEQFATEVLKNRSKLPGTSRLRTVGIYEALTGLARDASVTTTADLREATVRPEVKRVWSSVRGLGPLSWSYLLMNAGVDDEVKPDVMVQRFMNRALGADDKLPATEIKPLMRLVAANLGVSPRALDRAVWLYESPSRTR